MASPYAGKKVLPEMLVNVPKLITAYYSDSPDVSSSAQKVSFGTSGHRGSSFKKTFNEKHILATTQAICDYRKNNKINGPLYLGIDTHALSEPAFATCLSVLAGNNVTVKIDSYEGYTSTPQISLAILKFNSNSKSKRME